MIEDAIAYYHELLDGAFASDAQERLKSGTQHYRLHFGARPVCTVLRPLFITAAQYEYIKRESELVLSAITKLGAALMVDESLRGEMDLSIKEERIIAIEPGF